MKQKFYCPIKICPYSKTNAERVTKETGKVDLAGLPFSEALLHQTECIYITVECPLKCGDHIKRKDMDVHKSDCPTAESKCEKCELSYKRDEIDSHNCI
jgi:hypothetical protein